MKICSTLTGPVLLVVTLLGLAVSAQAGTVVTIYDPADDFSISNGNPNGVWSYGKQTGSIPFAPFASGRTWGPRNAAYAGIEVWDDGGSSWDPSIDYNSTASTVVAFGFTFTPGAVALEQLRWQ